MSYITHCQSRLQYGWRLWTAVKLHNDDTIDWYEHVRNNSDDTWGRDYYHGSIYNYDL